MVKSGRRKSDTQKQPRRVHTPEVFQVEAAECGAASLLMILKYHHCNVSMEELRYVCGVSRDGSSAADLVLAAEHYGMKGHGFSKSVEELRKFPLPCILHWGFNHFVVLEGIRGKRVYLNDPARGHRKITWEELDREFTGIVLYFEETEHFQRKEQPSDLLRLLQERLLGQTSTVVYLLLAGGLLVFPCIFMSILLQLYVDHVVMNGRTGQLVLLLTCLAGVYVLQIVLGWVRSATLARLKLKLNILTDYQLLRHLFRLPIPFFDQRYLGEMSQRVENNGDINSFLADKLIDAVLNVFESMFYLLMLWTYSPLLTAIGVLGTVLNMVLSLLPVQVLREMALKQRQDQNRLSGLLCAGLSVFSTIKANGAETDYASDILGAFCGTTGSEQDMGKAQQILSAFPSVISGIFQIVVLMIGGVLVINGSITAGMLTAFVQLLGGFTQPMNELIGYSQSIQTLKAEMLSIEDIEGTEEDARFRKEEETDQPVKPLQGEIEVRNITFSYRTTQAPVLQELSFRLMPGSCLGITGASGCGKSTLVRILAGILYPQSGEIRYDGIRIQDMTPQLLKKNIAVVGQSAFFFAGTIRENLTFWSKEISEAEMVEALKCADAYDMVNTLPGGMEYRLKEGAANLSGGQRQKLQIARALAEKPAILLLDEATSAMDPETEDKVMRNILRRGISCVIVAHRLSAIRSCDLILVMDRGRIVQCGRHEDLLQQEGEYRRLLEG